MTIAHTESQIGQKIKLEAMPFEHRVQLTSNDVMFKNEIWYYLSVIAISLYGVFSLNSLRRQMRILHLASFSASSYSKIIFLANTVSNDIETLKLTKLFRIFKGLLLHGKKNYCGWSISRRNQDRHTW